MKKFILLFALTLGLCLTVNSAPSFDDSGNFSLYDHSNGYYIQSASIKNYSECIVTVSCNIEISRYTTWKSTEVYIDNVLIENGYGGNAAFILPASHATRVQYVSFKFTTESGTSYWANLQLLPLM